MFHIHKWSKWVLVSMKTPYGNVVANERKCESCGLTQRRRLG